jgi:hypothetical protein
MIFSLRVASMFLASENKPDPLPKTLPSMGFQSREINLVIHLLRGNKPDPPNPLKHMTMVPHLQVSIQKPFLPQSLPLAFLVTRWRLHPANSESDPKI